MRYPLLALLALPLLAASCGDQGTKLPDDPVALAKALGEFGLYKGFYWSDDPEAGGYTWVYSPKDLNASQGGMLLLGYPAVPPGPKCDGCIYRGGVGRDWVQPVPQTRPMFTSAPDVLDLEAALPEGEFRIEHYLRIWGRWYKVVGRASVALANGGTRIEMTPYPAEAYPLPDLPEIYLYDKLPPAMMSAVCAQPGADRFKDPWAPAAPRPYYALYRLNALQRISYDGGRLLGSGYQEPRGDRYEYCPLCAAYYAVLEDMDYYYDVFVRFVNDEPRQARAYGLWWRLYNPRPLRVHKNPDGTYTCENFDAENLRAFEGPFTEAELRSRYGIDPANPPERYVGPR